MVSATDGNSSDSTVVRWRGEADSRLRTALRHVVASAFLTFGAIVGFALLYFGYLTLTGAAAETFVVFLVAVLFGGPFALLYLVALREELSPSELLPYELNLYPRYVLLATPVALLLIYGFVRFPPLGFAYLVAGPFLWGLLAAREAAGAIDVDAGTLTVDDGTAATADRGPRDVRQLRAHASLGLGGYRLVRLRYDGSAVLSRPPLLLVPDGDYSAVDAALSEIESRDYGVKVRRTSRGAKAFLVGFGLLFVAVAAGLVVATDGLSRALMPALLMACFGLLFVALAWLA
ncbi:hypothetical protein C474_03405 [Halogeometricum pallidum JCM 14848]|uniref:Uncharacterized protein n=1 Tax=Halogeometricum pallidum JCM 14848 TaxID=1227487 RepID=M0DIH2_HALPD|nr:hypothetical protein [Halogeometricum pallidum]ELZ33974.1 hypothetical protein C474_03405 [Halogeometricum pallidum JCM 14848]